MRSARGIVFVLLLLMGWSSIGAQIAAIPVSRQADAVRATATPPSGFAGTSHDPTQVWLSAPVATAATMTTAASLQQAGDAQLTSASSLDLRAALAAESALRPYRPRVSTPLQHLPLRI